MSVDTKPALTLAYSTKYCDLQNSCEDPRMAGVTGISDYRPATYTIDPGDSETITLSDPVQFLLISTPKPINVQLNGTGDNIYVSRTLALIGQATTSIIVSNDAAANPKQVQVNVILAEGTGVT